jgi:hypothetical protein
MGLHDNGHQIGFWRTPGHVRKCRLADGFTLQTVMDRHRRRRMMDSVVVTTSSILLAAAVVFTVAFLVHASCSEPTKTPVEYAPSERIRVVRIGDGTCSR